jgi:hypothetical protein
MNEALSKHKRFIQVGHHAPCPYPSPTPSTPVLSFITVVRNTIFVLSYAFSDYPSKVGHHALQHAPAAYATFLVARLFLHLQASQGPPPS